MKKAVKWTLIVFGSLIVLVLAAAIILPVVFKDDIKEAINKEIAKSVNADVVFEDFDLSLFKNFPGVTLQITKLGVVNREPFAGEVLFATEEFQVELNLKDVLFGDQLRVKGISLIRPLINVQVLADGKANYDIAIPSADTTTSEEPSDFSFGIDHWEIVDGELTYNDLSLPFLMKLKGFNHSGSGDFTQDVFDLKTKTTADSVTMAYDGAEYLTDKRADIDAVISISEQYTKYTFKENSAKINDFAMKFDGWFKMNENDFGMDINFDTPETSFKSLLSIVPGMFTESFKNIETKGDLSFKGFVKGTYSEKQMPAFNLALLVKDAMFKYPDLPTAVENINVDLLVDNKDGVIDNTVVDLKKLHLDFGSNPVDARALITKIYPTNVDAEVKAKLNLAELNKMFPMEGLTMKGSYGVDLKAKGVYDSLKKLIPAIDAKMSLDGGYVKSKDFPLAMDDIHFNSTIKNTSGKMAETFINVNDFSVLMDGEKFNANLALQNLDDYTWDLKAKGGVDLEKMTKVFPIEGMTLAGKVKADIETKGKYSDVQAQKYDRLPTSGTASLKDFKYLSKDVPAVGLATADMVFDPKKIELKNVNGTIGRSDFAVSGSVLNYLGYVFGKGETIKGIVNFNSNLLDLNEFMSGTEETTTTDTTSMSVIPVPRDIEFTLKSDIKKVKLMDFNITNAAGDIIVKDGIANLSGLKFNMLGGSFTVNGAYNTKDIAHPKYDFGLNINSVSMKEASSASSLISNYAPIAGLVNGNFSLKDFKISGELLKNMSPNLATVNGGGAVEIAQASLKDSKLVAGITSLTKLDNTSEVTLKDVAMSAKIENGRLSVKPFDVKFGNYKTTIAGSTGLDQSIDYSLKMDVPAGKLGAEFNNFISSKTGAKTDPNGTVPINIGLGGTVKNPSPKLIASAEQKEQVKEALTNTAKEEGQKAIEKAVKGTEAEKIIGGILGGNKKDTAKVKSDTTKAKTPTQQEKKVEDAKKAINDLFKKKKN